METLRFARDSIILCHALLPFSCLALYPRPENYPAPSLYSANTGLSNTLTTWGLYSKAAGTWLPPPLPVGLFSAKRPHVAALAEADLLFHSCLL